MPQATGGWEPLQIIHHHFPHEEKEMETFIAVQPGSGYVVNVTAPWNNARDDEGYAAYLRQPEEWAALDRFIRLCARRGKRIWIYDEPGFPSGGAGRRVVEADPAFAVTCLACRSMETEGGSGEMELPEGEVLLAAALPEGKDGLLQEARSVPLSCSEGRLYWELTPGAYRVLAIVHKPCLWTTGAGVRYMDCLNPQAVEAFIRCTHESYRENLSPEAFSHIEAFFSDEPGLPVHGCSAIFDEPDPVVPWTAGLNAVFESRYGYQVIPRLTSLFFDTADAAGVRRDFWQLVSRRLEEAYFGRIADWCARYDILLTGHLYGEESLSMQIGLNGELFGLQRRMTLPGVDRLFCTNPRGVLPEKTAASAAELLGRRLVMSESSACFEDSEWHIPHSAAELLHSCLYQMVLGINTIASYFSSAHYPAEEFQAAYAAIGRVGEAMAGTHRAPVLFLIPMETAWARYRPVNAKYWSVDPLPYSPGQSQALKKLEQDFDLALTGLLSRQLDFDLIDSRGLKDCRAEKGAVFTAHEQFQLVAAMDTGDFSAEILRTFKRLAEQGGRLLFLREKAAFSCEVLELLQRYPDRVAVATPEEAAAAAARLCIPVLETEEESPFLWVRRCQKAEEDTLLLHCRDGETHTVTAVLEENEQVLACDPLSGREWAVPVQNGRAELIIPAKSGLVIRLLSQ